ncbi:hypothetical protein CVS37_41420 [Burkholderia lata]|nr:hypothetical protein CVS37_41420 [Burkholderia lata]
MERARQRAALDQGQGSSSVRHRQIAVHLQEDQGQLTDGKTWDLAVSQFAESVPYDDTPSARDAALADNLQQG